jgi:hypothetical protein
LKPSLIRRRTNKQASIAVLTQMGCPSLIAILQLFGATPAS